MASMLQTMTECGMVEGMPSANQMFTVFRGIPFAKPPVGELRWRAPQAPEPWEGVRKAYTFASIPMQERFSSEGGGNTLAGMEFYCREYPMSEDCLYLNIWTPAETPEDKLPVAVYIHGGGFETGYSYLNAYDGDGFAKRGIIMVSVAYRLNIFGYLALPELAEEDLHHSTGNYGTLDQIAALKWVRRNIHNFGGDPENITLFGQSAGGSSVEKLCGTPLTDGDFKRAIMQSCGGLSRSAAADALPLEQAFVYGKEYMEVLGVHTVAEARDLSAETLLEAFIRLKGGPGYLEHYMPCVDGYVHPERLDLYFRHGRHTVKDTMVGCTAAEFRQPGKPAPTYEEMRQIARQRYGDQAEAFLAAIQAEDPEACRVCFEDLIGDDMLAGDLAWCRNQISLGRNPAFLYYFTYVPPGTDQAYHSSEHHYVFQTLTRSRRPYTGQDYDLSNLLADSWANFMKTGDPDGGRGLWKPYTAEEPEALIINGPCHMGTVPVNPSVAFHMAYSLGELEEKDC